MLQRTLFDPDPFSTVDHEALTVRDGYLMAYRGNTRSGYATDLRDATDIVSHPLVRMIP